MATILSTEVKRGPGAPPMDPELAAKRAAEMAQLYRSGQTLEVIGRQFQMSRERVRQILRVYYHFNRRFGGAHVASEQRAQRAAEAREQRFRRRYGMSSAERKAHIAQYGSSMRKGSPLNVFINQRRTMIYTHGIPWELTFVEWWEVWQKSGKWEDRKRATRGESYCLGRLKGSGSFNIDNVCIKTIKQAASDYQRNRPDRDEMKWRKRKRQSR